MNKIMKNKKLIILIAIIAIIVIIGIIIGANAIKVNIANGRYDSANNNQSNGNLLPEYIKAGITLGGVTGTLQDLDTSDATATPEDIAWPKTAYVNGIKITGTRGKPIELDPDTVYYADLTGDGTVDGVIYADLAVGGSGVWNGDSWSNYSYEAETGLKEYCIINEEYTDEHFGTGKVIAPIDKDSNKKDRFYVMALDDVNPGTRYCWYDAAYGKLDKTVATNYNNFGEGRTNTEYVMNKWKNSLWGKQNDNGTYLDMWGVIEEQFNDGWFVPSKSEWSAFGDKFKITSSNYVNQFGFSDWYWSSSENGTNYAYGAYFSYGYVSRSHVDNLNYVRLSTTFKFCKKLERELQVM